ncbi:MAG: hypothetical protein ACOZNI_29560 [Myxococcota bacterium]
MWVTNVGPPRVDWPGGRTAFPLPLPLNPPCERPEYAVEAASGAVVRLPGAVATCGDADCVTRGEARVREGALVCDVPLCRWVTSERPSPLDIEHASRWSVAARCAGGGAMYGSSPGDAYAEWPASRPVTPIGALPGFRERPAPAGASLVAAELASRVVALLAECDRIRCSPAAEAGRARFEALARRPRGEATLGPAVSWAPAESGRPAGWSARFASGLEVAVGQVSEGGSGWVLRAGGDEPWLRAALDADGPTGLTVWMGGAWVRVAGEGEATVVANGEMFARATP